MLTYYPNPDTYTYDPWIFNQNADDIILVSYNASNMA